MKIRSIILSSLFFVTISLFGQGSIHRNKAYVSNPELARQDALNHAQSGNISEAILCYKKYAALTGKDMTAEISKLERTQYPSWYDASSMLALPMSDGSVLIVYKILRYFSVWNTCQTINLDVSGVWDSWVGQEEFKVIQQAGLYIPSDGLFSRAMREISSHSSATYIATGQQIGGRRMMNPTIKNNISKDKESLICYMMTANGEKKIDGGSYEKDSDDNKRVVRTIDNRRDFNVYYYPTRTLRYVNGSWQIENKKNESTASSSATQIKSNASVSVSYF